jgi:hypothetical protein
MNIYVLSNVFLWKDYNRGISCILMMPIRNRR